MFTLLRLELKRLDNSMLEEIWDKAARTYSDVRIIFFLSLYTQTNKRKRNTFFGCLRHALSYCSWISDTSHLVVVYVFVLEL